MPNLIEAHFNGSTPPTISNNVFSGVKSEFKVFVPESGLSEYHTKWTELGYNTANVYPKAEDNCIIYYSSSQITPNINITQKPITNNCTNGVYYKIINVNTQSLPPFFYNSTSVEKIILPESIKTLYDNAFSNCEKLEYVSSAGLRVLLALNKKTKNNLCLEKVQNAVMEILEVTGFVNILAIR